MRKLTLTEDLFDSVEVDIEPKEDLVVDSPEEGEDIGIASIIIDAINDEWEAIYKYNDIIAQLNFSNKTDMVDVIKNIVAEENEHVGQLEALLEIISPNVKNIELGKEAVSDSVDEQEEVL